MAESVTSPTPDQALGDLREVLPDIYRALEHAIFKAKSHFEAEGVQWEESAFSHLVRLHAKDYLRRRNREAVEIEQVNLCGLWIRVPPYHLKIWKIDDDGLQKASAKCPTQFQQFALTIDGQQICPIFLAIYWNVDSKKNLASVSLAYPKHQDDPTKRECWWLVPIPPFEAPSREVPAPPAGDLPIPTPARIPQVRENK